MRGEYLGQDATGADMRPLRRCGAPSAVLTVT